MGGGSLTRGIMRAAAKPISNADVSNNFYKKWKDEQKKADHLREEFNKMRMKFHITLALLFVNGAWLAVISL